MRDLRERLAVLDIVGGSVYDALVGQASGTNGRTLLTRDRRAERTYRSLGSSINSSSEPPLAGNPAFDVEWSGLRFLDLMGAVAMR